MERRRRRPFLKQKLPLYFDANFPRQLIDDIKQDRAWRKRCSIHSAAQEGNQRRDDKFQLEFCKAKGYVLVTLDDDFMNDRKYPFSRIPGIIRIVAAKNDADSIEDRLATLLGFISSFPAPRMFVGDTKFQVSPQGCVIRGRGAVTGRIKEVRIKRGDTNIKVMEAFTYFQR
jgi:predicted nuclease of predicted toxin-antitoxin system